MEEIRDRIADYMEVIEQARVALYGLKADIGPDVSFEDLRGELGAAVQEVRSDLACAMLEAQAMRKAAALLQRVVEQLDADRRAALVKAVELLCDVDWATRLDCLAGEVRELRALRAARARN